MDEIQSRTLYVRLPHTIRDMDEIRDLFAGDIHIKLPRQSSRHCHVIFSSIEEKMKNLKAIRKKLIDNKRIIAYPPKVKPEDQKKKKKKAEKKVAVPTPKPTKVKLTRMLFVSNIHPKTRIKELKAAFGNCKTAAFLNNTGNSTTRQAIVKLVDPKVAAEYLKKERPRPVLHGNQLVIKPDTRKQKKKKPGLKIGDGVEDITDKVDFKNDNKKKKKVEENTEEEDQEEEEEIVSEEGVEEEEEEMDSEADVEEESGTENEASENSADSEED